MKDYGLENQVESNRYVIYQTIGTLLIFAGLILFGLLELTPCVDQLVAHSHNVVAESRGQQ